MFKKILKISPNNFSKLGKVICATNDLAILAIIVMVLAANPSYANNCDLTKLDFGINQQQLKTGFGFDALDIATTGEANMVSGASEICNDLPETAVVEFTLIDNTFVQMLIKNKNTVGSLFDYATKIFGDMDNKEKDTRKIKPGEKVKLGLWTKDSNYSVVYTSYTKDKDQFEKLAITSNNYKQLFSAANAEKVQAADDYLKENKLGKYSPDSKDKLDDNGADKIQDMKDGYDKTGLHKDKKLKENENDRGYHYESK